jgi:hypothetical protein
VRTFAIVGFLAVSCGSIHGVANAPSTASASRSAPVATASPGPTIFPAPTTASSARTGQCPAVEPAPQFPASTPSIRNLALELLRGSTQFVVRDITDVSHPFTVSTQNNLGPAQFVSATELSYADTGRESPQPLFRAPLAGSPLTLVAQICIGAYSFAWSPDGTSLAYVTVTSDRSASQLHVVSSGYDQVVSSMPALPWGTGCESPACSDHLDSRVLYSPSGTYISFIENWGLPTVRVWTADGKTITRVDSSAPDFKSKPTMSVWSGNNLYFRDDKGVQIWRDGVQSILLPGVAWIRPKASPAGGQIVYEVRDSSGTAHVDLLDTSTDKVRELGSSRSEPAFLTSRYVWYQGERPCHLGEFCDPSFPTLSGKTYIYDLQTGTEAESIITNVLDVWPHPA